MNIPPYHSINMGVSPIKKGEISKIPEEKNITLSVSEGVPPSWLDNDQPDGNTMLCLEKMLIEVYKKWIRNPSTQAWLEQNEHRDIPVYPTEDVDSLEQEAAQSIQTFMQTCLATPKDCATATSYSGGFEVFEREGNDPDSPIICETYTERNAQGNPILKEVERRESLEEMKARIADEKQRGVHKFGTDDLFNWTKMRTFHEEIYFYQFKQNFSLLFKMPNGVNYLEKRQQVIKTTVKVPSSLCNENSFLESKRRALLTAKHYYQACMAAINPQHKAHHTIKPVIESLRRYTDFGIETTSWGYRNAENSAMAEILSSSMVIPLIQIPKKKKLQTVAMKLSWEEEGYSIKDEGKTWEKVDKLTLKRLKEKNPSQIMTGSRLIQSEAERMIVKGLPALEAIKKLDKKDGADLKQAIEDERNRLSIGNDPIRYQIFVADYLRRELFHYQNRKCVFDYEINQLQNHLFTRPTFGYIPIPGTPRQMDLAIAAFQEALATFNPQSHQKKMQLREAYNQVLRLRKEIKKMEDEQKRIQKSSEKILALLDIPTGSNDYFFKISLQVELQRAGVKGKSKFNMQSYTQSVKENLLEASKEQRRSLNTFKPLMADLDPQMRVASQLLNYPLSRS